MKTSILKKNLHHDDHDCADLSGATLAKECAMPSVSPPANANPAPAVTEISLLIPASQAEWLEQAARHQGITLGQFLRRIISSHPLAVNADSVCLAK